jgi:cytochrome c556
LPAVRKLAENIGDFAAAGAALAQVKEVAAAGGEPAAQLDWQAVAPLDALMRQVPIVNNALRRGLDPKRFDRGKKQIAGQAATLAAIAQASSFDLSDADDSSADDWRALCREMRDAAGQINSAAHGGDPTGAQAGAKRLAQNCDACHEKFRGGK